MLFIGLGLIVPLVEEAVKSLVPALAGAGQKPAVARLFLWGVASGAGFAVVEGMLNAGLGTQEWASVALLRIGSSAMHCLTAGLTGWGWGKAWAQRRWLHLLLAYALAVATHGLWNSISVGMIATAGTLEQGALQSALVTTAFVLLALLTLGMIAALMILAKRLSKEIGGVT
jgi:RsiW-degrading membrane proteinase PrsW (M82 family)